VPYSLTNEEVLTTAFSSLGPSASLSILSSPDLSAVVQNANWNVWRYLIKSANLQQQVRPFQTASSDGQAEIEHRIPQYK
jgi:hypothetical protein